MPSIHIKTCRCCGVGYRSRAAQCSGLCYDCRRAESAKRRSEARPGRMWSHEIRQGELTTMARTEANREAAERRRQTRDLDWVAIGSAWREPA